MNILDKIKFPISKEGDELIVGQEPVLGPGVRGYALIVGEQLWIPAIYAEKEGSGDVGRFLDSLPRDIDIVFPTVISTRLYAMLERRGWQRMISSQTGDELMVRPKIAI